MLFIFSAQVLIRYMWQLKTVVFLHRCLICAVLLLIYWETREISKNIDNDYLMLLNGLIVQFISYKILIMINTIYLSPILSRLMMFKHRLNEIKLLIFVKSHSASVISSIFNLNGENQTSTVRDVNVTVKKNFSALLNWADQREQKFQCCPCLIHRLISFSDEPQCRCIGWRRSKCRTGVNVVKLVSFVADNEAK